MTRPRGKDLLDGVPIFVAVAEALSFTRAARRLGISPSAASQAVRALEARLGTPLIQRSTRSMRLTEAGARYLEQAAPALAALEEATREVAGHAGRPSGLLRLTMPRAAFDGLVAEALPSFRQRYPEVAIEIDIEGRLVDIVQRGFDAGFRYGDLLAKDMTAVEVLPASTSVLLAAAPYLERHQAPSTPGELAAHAAIVCRSRTTGLVAPWPLTDGRTDIRVDPRVELIAGDLATQVDLTARGLGISCAPLRSVERHLAVRSLRRLLPGWSVPLEPIFAYHPSRRPPSAALRAFLKHLPRVDA